MVKKLAVILVIAALVSLNVAAFSHPASSIEVKQDKAKGMLIIKIIHPVRDAAKHYISKIVIKINGKVINTINRNKQMNKNHESLNVQVGAYKKGSKIEIITTCNVRGVKSITVIGA